MTTLLVYSPASEHDFPRHPENAQRPRAIYQLLQKEKLLPHLQIVSATAVREQQLAEFHDPYMIDYVQAACLRGNSRLDADTYITPESFDLACMAVGAACKAVDSVMEGQADNGFVIARPPGHHAEYRRPGGFCLFNNIAGAARHAQKKHGVKRVAILDFDVHHGNGTQDIFYDDESVLFISLHQYGDFFYPGSGGLREIGNGKGEGANINVPLPDRVGDKGYETIFETFLLPQIRAFEPELLLISAGYDAHWADPLASAALSLQGYGRLSQMLVSWADALCNGRIIFVLEGGYLLDALSQGVANSIYALLKKDEMMDSLGAFKNKETDVTRLLESLHKTHLIK